MAITIDFPLDELQLEDLQDQGYTQLALYYSLSPEGPYEDSGVASDPVDFDAAETAGIPYLFSFPFTGGNASMWFKVLATDGVTSSALTDAQAFHGGGGTNLKTIRKKIGLLTHTMIIGEATSDGEVDGSTCIASVAKFKRYRDDYFGGTSGVDGWIYHDITNGEWTIISDWEQSTGTFTLDPALSNQQEEGTEFEVMSRWTPDEYRDAINWAINECFPTLSRPTVDTSIVTEEDIFEYQLPNSIKIVNSVEIESLSFEDSTDLRTRGQPWRNIPFRVIDDGLSQKLEFKKELGADRRLRVIGTAILSNLYNDTDFIEAIDPQVDVVVYLSAYRLYSLLVNTDAASDIDRFQNLAGQYMMLYEQAKKKRGRRRNSTRIWGEQARWNNY